MNIETLEREHGPEVVNHLSQALHMPGVSLEQMEADEAAFDLVPYGEATRRGCVALRNAEGAVSLVLGDPFDLDTHGRFDDRSHSRSAQWWARKHRTALAAAGAAAVGLVAGRIGPFART